MKKFVFLFAFIILLTSCDKDGHRRMKYRVVSKTSCEIGYSVNNKWFNESQTTGDWSKSYRVKKGSPFHLAAFKTGSFFDVTILVYFDGDLYATSKTDDTADLIEIKGTVPE